MGLNDSQATFSNPVEATSSRALISLGPGPFDGVSGGKYNGSVLGTVVGFNQPAGYAGDLYNYQIGGSSKHKADNLGRVYVEGAIIVPKFEYIQDVQNQVAAATYAVSHSIFIAPNSGETWQVAGLSISFGTASASGTLQLEVATGTQAIAGGTNQLTGTISTAGAINTAVNGTIIAAPTVIAAGNRVNLIFGGSATGLLNAIVTLVLQRLS